MKYNIIHHEYSVSWPLRKIHNIGLHVFVQANIVSLCHVSMTLLFLWNKYIVDI